MTAASPRSSLSIAIHCVTSGRLTLRATLDSIAMQPMAARDEVLLVCDKSSDEGVTEMWNAPRLPGRLIFLQDGPHRDWGHTPRNLTLKLIRQDYVIAIDDDDVLAPGALDAIRDAILETGNPEFFLFRMVFPSGKTVWRSRDLGFGNVGTPIFIHPQFVKLGEYTPRYGGDRDFIEQTILYNPNLPLNWRQEAVALINPHAVAGCPPRFHVEGSGRLCWDSLSPCAVNTGYALGSAIEQAVSEGAHEIELNVRNLWHDESTWLRDGSTPPQLDYWWRTNNRRADSVSPSYWIGRDLADKEVNHKTFLCAKEPLIKVKLSTLK